MHQNRGEVRSFKGCPASLASNVPQQASYTMRYIKESPKNAQ